MWMNESEIDEAVERLKAHPVLGGAAQFLSAFRHEVNAHSDGWAYWHLPTQAADKLMTLLHGHVFAGMGSYPHLPEPTMADVKKAIAPIKAFYTRRGFKAGMKLPLLEVAAKRAVIAAPGELTQKARVLAESLAGIASLLLDEVGRGCPEATTVLELAQDAEEKAGGVTGWILSNRR